MIDRTAGDVDQVLEIAAQAIEQADIHEQIAGIDAGSARRRRDREDGALRLATVTATRAKAAAAVRALKQDRSTDAIAVLRQLAALDPSADHRASILDAWPLSWMGWCDIALSVACTSIVYPPPTAYRITLTDRGRAVLAAADTASTTPKEIPR